MKKIFVATLLPFLLCGCGHNIISYGEGFGVKIFSAVLKDNASADMDYGSTDAPLSIRIAIGDQTTGYEAADRQSVDR